MEPRLGAASPVMRLVVVLALLATPTLAAADDDLGADATADDWMRVGLARYDAQDWKGAIDAFQAGNELDPRPAFLFAIAQAERRRGNCKGAVVYYQKFLASSPPEAQADAARQQRHLCEQAVTAASPEPEAQPERVRVVEVATPAPPAEVREEAPWWTDPIADGALAATLILGGTGVGLFVASSGAAGDAAHATTYDEHARLRDRATSLHTDAVIALGATAAVAGIAVWRIFFHDRPTHAVEVAPGPGVGVAIGGRF